MHFATLSSLWEFEMQMQGLPLQIDVKNILLTRLINSEQLSIALNKFSVIILNKDELLRDPLSEIQTHKEWEKQLEIIR